MSKIPRRRGWQDVDINVDGPAGNRQQGGGVGSTQDRLIRGGPGKQQSSFNSGGFHGENSISGDIAAGTCSITIPSAPTPALGIGMLTVGVDADTGDLATVLGNVHVLLVAGNGSLAMPLAVSPDFPLTGQVFVISIPGATSGTCSVSLFYPTR